MPKASPRMSHGASPLPRTANEPTPAITIRVCPKTTWWMCSPPGDTFPGHQLVPRRIIRTLNRMNRKELIRPTSRRNSGCRPLSTILSRYASSTDCHMGLGPPPGSGRAAWPEPGSQAHGTAIPPI